MLTPSEWIWTHSDVVSIDAIDVFSLTVTLNGCFDGKCEQRFKWLETNISPSYHVNVIIDEYCETIQLIFNKTGDETCKTSSAQFPLLLHVVTHMSEL